MKLKFAGTLKEITVETACKGKSKSTSYKLKFAPDIEYTASRKDGDSTVMSVVFYPIDSKKASTVCRLDDINKKKEVVFSTTMKDWFGLVLGTHCEMELDDKGLVGLFDVNIETPSFGAKKKFVVSTIRMR